MLRGISVIGASFFPHPLSPHEPGFPAIPPRRCQGPGKTSLPPHLPSQVMTVYYAPLAEETTTCKHFNFSVVVQSAPDGKELGSLH